MMNTDTFLQCLFLGLSCAIFAVVVIVIMSKERIINWWFLWGDKVGHKRVGNSMQEKWFYKPIWGCEKCFAGQLALWIYFFSHIKAVDPVDWSEEGWFNLPGYNLLHHLLTVAIAIMASVILSFYITHITQQTDD